MLLLFILNFCVSTPLEIYWLLHVLTFSILLLYSFCVVFSPPDIESFELFTIRKVFIVEHWIYFMGIKREREREHVRMREFGRYDLFIQFYWMNEEKWRRLTFQIVIRVTVLNPIQPISNDHQLKGQWPQHFFFRATYTCLLTV